MPADRDHNNDEQSEVREELEERAQRRREEEARRAERRRRQFAGGGAAAGAGAIAGREAINRLTGDEGDAAGAASTDEDEASLDVFEDLPDTAGAEPTVPPDIDETPDVPERIESARPGTASVPDASVPPGIPAPPAPRAPVVDGGEPGETDRPAPAPPPPPMRPDFTPDLPARDHDRVQSEQPAPPPPAPSPRVTPPPMTDLGPSDSQPPAHETAPPPASADQDAEPTPPAPEPAPFERPDGSTADTEPPPGVVDGEADGSLPGESIESDPPIQDVPVGDSPPSDSGPSTDDDSSFTAPDDSFPGAPAPPSSSVPPSSGSPGSSSPTPVAPPSSGSPGQDEPDGPDSGSGYPPPDGYPDAPPVNGGGYPEQPGYPDTPGYPPPVDGEYPERPDYPDQPDYPEQPADDIRYLLPGHGDGYPHPRDVYGEPDIVTAAGRQFEVYNEGRIIIGPPDEEGAYQIYWLDYDQNAYDPDFHWPGTNNDMQVVDMIATVEPHGDHYINYYPRFYQPIVEEIEAEGYPDYVDPALTGGIPYVTQELGESVFTYTDEEGRQIVKTVNRFDGSATIEYYDSGVVTYYPEGHPDYPNGYLGVSGELDPSNPYYPPDYVPDDEYPPDDIEPGYGWPVVLEAEFNGDPDLGFYLATVRYPDGSIHQFDITGRHYVVLDDGIRVLVDEPPRMIDINTDTGVIKLDYGEGLPDIQIDPQGNLYSDIPEIQPRIADTSYEEGDAYLYVEQENGQLIAYDVEDGRGYEVPNREPESWDQSVFDEPYILNHFYGWHDEYGVPIFATVDGSTYYYSEDYGQLRVLTLGEQSAAGLGFTNDWEEIAQGYLEEYPDGEEAPWDPSYDDGEGWIRVEVDGLLWEIHTDGTSYTIDENGERILNQAEAPPYRVTYVTQDGRALIETDDGNRILRQDGSSSQFSPALLDWDPTEDDGEGWARVAYDGVIYEYRSDGTTYRIEGANSEPVDLYPELQYISNYGEVHLTGPDNVGYIVLRTNGYSSGPGDGSDIYSEWFLYRTLQDDPTAGPEIVASNLDEGWVQIQRANGSVIQYNLDGTAYYVQADGGLSGINNPKLQVLAIFGDDTAVFVTDDGVQFTFSQDGTIDIADTDIEIGAGAPDDAPPPEYIDEDDYADLVGSNYLPTPSEDANPENVELVYPDGSIHRFGYWETPDGERFYHVIVNPDGTVTPVEYPEMIGDGDTYLHFRYESGALYASGSASSSYWVTPDGHYVTPYGSNYGQVQALDAERGIVLIRNYAGRFEYDLDGDTTYVTEIHPDGSRGERVESDIRLLDVDEQNGTAVFQRADGTIYQLDETGREMVLWMGEERAEYLGLTGWEPGDEHYLFDDDGNLVEVEWTGQEWVPVDYAAPDYTEDYIPDQTYLPEVLESDDPDVLWLRYPDGTVHEYGYDAEGNPYHYALIAEGTVAVDLPSYPYGHLVSIGPEPYVGAIEAQETVFHIAPDGTLHRLQPNADYTVSHVDAEAGIVVTYTDLADGRMIEWDLDGGTTYVTSIFPDGTRGPREESQNLHLLSIDESDGSAVFRTEEGDIIRFDETGHLTYLALGKDRAGNMSFIDYELPEDAQQYVRDEDGSWVEADEDETIPLDGQEDADGIVEYYGPYGGYPDPTQAANLVYEYETDLGESIAYYGDGARVVTDPNGQRSIEWYIDEYGNPADFSGINQPIAHSDWLNYLEIQGYGTGFIVREDAGGEVYTSGMPWDSQIDLSYLDPSTYGEWMDPFAAYGPPDSTTWAYRFEGDVVQTWNVDGQAISRILAPSTESYALVIGELPDAVRLVMRHDADAPELSIYSQYADGWRPALWDQNSGDYMPAIWDEASGEYIPAVWNADAGEYVAGYWDPDTQSWVPANSYAEVPPDGEAPDMDAGEEQPDDYPPPQYQDFDPDDYGNYAPTFVGGEHGNAVRIQLHDGTVLECHPGGPTYRIENPGADQEYAVQIEGAPIFEGNGVAGIYRFQSPDGSTLAYNSQGYYLGESPEPYAEDVTIDPDNGIVEYTTRSVAGTEDTVHYELRGDQTYASAQSSDGEWGEPQPTSSAEIVTIDPGPPAAAIMLFGGGGSHVAIDEYGYISYPYSSAEIVQSAGMYNTDYSTTDENPYWVWDAESGQYVPAELLDGVASPVEGWEPAENGEPGGQFSVGLDAIQLEEDGAPEDAGVLYLGPAGDSHPHPAQVYEQSIEQIDLGQLETVLGWGDVTVAHLYPDGSIVAWYGDGSQRVAWLTAADGAPISSWQQVLDSNAYLDYQVVVTDGVVTTEIPAGSQMLIEGVPEEEAEGEYTFYGRYNTEAEAEASDEAATDAADEDEIPTEPIEFSTTASSEQSEDAGQEVPEDDDVPLAEQPIDPFEDQPEDEAPADEFSQQLEDEVTDQIEDEDDDEGTL